VDGHGAKDRRPVVVNPKLRIARFSKSALKYGVERYDTEGVPVRIFSAAKTVAGCFKYRNKSGLDLSIEALRDSLRQKIATPSQIWAFHGGAGLKHEGERNVAASVRQLLLNIASKENADFAFFLTWHALELVLYRLSRSPHQGNFVLKGALLFRVWAYVVDDDPIILLVANQILGSAGFNVLLAADGQSAFDRCRR
jgi:hypothetical protein